MYNDLGFDDLLRLIDARSTAFRAAVAAAPSLDTKVPTCPDWTLRDLVRHLGEGRHKWAAFVAAGPAAAPAAWSAPAAPEDRTALLAWLASATERLLDALREAGPERGCWSWWGDSQSPQTSGAVARHQLQELAVHTYDAQVAVGAPQPLPADVALDGVEEFLVTCVATTVAWPHEPAVIDYHATEGRSWRIRLSASGARIDTLPADDAGFDALTADGAGFDAVPADGAGFDAVTADGAGFDAVPADGAGFDAVPADGAGFDAVPADGAGFDAVPADGAGFDALPADGAQVGSATAGGPADVAVTGTAGELVLFFYGRTPPESMRLDGDRRPVDRLIAWDPDDVG